MKEKNKFNLLINTALLYSILAMVGGVFFREFTKMNQYEGVTSLSYVHVHLFAMGMLWFLILVLLEGQFHITNHKKFKVFYYIYNIGMLITTGTFLWRGISQVLLLNLSKGIDSSISGIAGIGHALIGVGIILFFVILKKSIKNVAITKE